MKRILASILLAASLVAGSAYAAISGTARASAQSDNCGSGDWGSASCQVNISGVTGFTANDLIVVVWSRNDDNTDVYPILPSEGGYTQGPYYSTGFAGSLGCSSAWKKATGSETTITPSWDSGASSVQGGRVLAVVIPGTDLDLDALGDSGENEADIASATTSLSSGSASNSTATGLAIAGLCADNLTANDATAYSNGFAEQGGVDGGTTSADAWIATKVLSSAASQSTAATITNDQGYGAILVFNAAGGTCPATCAGGRSARCITDISDASDPDNLLYGLSPAAVANEDTVCYDPSSVLGHTVNVTAAGWPSIASGGSQLTDSFDYCIMDDAAACGTDGTYEVTFQPVITSVTGTGTGQTTADITVTPSGPTEGTVQSVAISKTSYDTYGAPTHAQIRAGVDGNNSNVAWGSEFTKSFLTTVSPGWTFSRASIQTYTNSSGNIAEVSSGNPAFNYSGGSAQGVLLEGSRTNLALYSDDLSNAAWVATNVTKGSTSTTDIYGNANTKVEATASAANGTLLQSITAGNASYTYSVYLKRKTGTGNIDVTVNGGTGWTTCTVTASWGPCSVTATVTNPQVGIRIVTSGDAVYMAGSQAEGGSFYTSRIPTTTAPVTRQPTSLTRSWNFPTNNFSGQAKFKLNPAQSSLPSAAVVLEFASSGGGSRYSFRVTSTAVALYKVVGDGNTATYSVTAASGFPAGQDINLRFKQSSAGLAIWVNGLTVYTNTASTAQANFTSAPITAYLGTNYLSGENSNVTVESLTIYNEAKSDAFLEALQ